MITPDAAWSIIRRSVRPLAVVPKQLDQATGYCIATPVYADRDLPPADRAAMDGFAVRAADLARLPARLAIIGEVAAGSPARPRVIPGTCARIMTGANVPPGADTVVMVEYTTEKDQHAVFSASAPQGANILRRAEDASRHACLIPKATVLNAMAIACCAAVGKAAVRVYRRPRIAIICTGTELRPVDARVATHEMRNSNGPALAAALRQWGYSDLQIHTIADSRKGLQRLLRRMVPQSDMILLTGGMSVGKYDFVRESLEACGADIRFHGVAMKPGKPVLYAAIGTTTKVFGLPGNPLSAMTGFHEFALPALRRMAGLPSNLCRPTLRIPLATELQSKGGRIRFVLGYIVWGHSGPALQVLKSQSSSDVAAGPRADGALVIPAECSTLEAGVLVDFRPWRPLP